MPELKRGSVIVMGNASFHKPQETMDIIRKAGYFVLFFYLHRAWKISSYRLIIFEISYNIVICINLVTSLFRVLRMSYTLRRLRFVTKLSHTTILLLINCSVWVLTKITTHYGV